MKIFDKIIPALKKNDHLSPDLSKKLNNVISKLETLELDQENDDLIVELRKDINISLRKNVYTNIFLNDKPLTDYFYFILIELAKLKPINEEKGQWECPITLEVHYQSDPRIVLTTGYCFEREALLNWFENSKKFICP